MADDGQAGQELLRQNDETFRTGAAQILGADGLQALQDYERALPVQPIVTDLAGALASGTNAMTEAQTDQLTALLASLTLNYQKGQEANPGQIDWTQALSQAAAVLTPAQVEMLRANNATVIANDEFNTIFAQAVGR